MGWQENLLARVPRADNSRSSAPSIYGVSRGFNHQTYLPLTTFPRELIDTECSGGGHVLLSNSMLYEHVIAGSSKVVWIQTAFGPVIHHLFPHITFDLPWFQLRDRLRKLSLEHVVSPQWTVAEDLILICNLGAPARFSAIAQHIHPPTLESAKLCLRGGALLLTLNNNISRRMTCRCYADVSQMEWFHVSLDNGVEACLRTLEMSATCQGYKGATCRTDGFHISGSPGLGG
jgi:hypothetical protein